MDKRTIIGFVMIAALLTVWMTYNSSQKDKEARIEKLRSDSTAAANHRADSIQNIAKKKTDDSLAALAKKTNINVDSLNAAKKVQAVKDAYGMFLGSKKPTDSLPLTIENEVLKATIYPLGGRIGQVELKGMKTSSGQPLILFYNDSTHFGLQFFDNKERRFSSDSLYFRFVDRQNVVVKGKDSASIRVRLYPDSVKDAYIEYCYTLHGNSNLLGCTVTFAGMDKLFSSNQRSVDLAWSQQAPSQEQNLDNQRNVATVFYRFDGEDNVENLGERGSDKKKEPAGDLKWVSFKQQFFSSILIADARPFVSGCNLEVTVPSSPFAVKDMSAMVSIPYGRTAHESFGMHFYFGPNKYDLLKSYDQKFEREINLGSSLFGWLNRYAFVPLFNWLSSIFTSYGLIILLMTIIVKIILFPIAYKSFLSQAKMRVLKPEMDELTAKYKDEPMKKQQATMELYRKAGVNPAAGCIPLLLQFPILIALIRLFPNAFELRQQGFLWAHDLSTYDSIWNFGFKIPFYGDHMSLFALLMTASTVLYTWLNQQVLSPGNNQLPGMKWLIYIMPVFFLGFLNTYSAALSYYYLVSNLINFAQMALMKRFVDHDAIRAKIEENKKKPKKSGLMQRLEQAQRQRMQEIQKQQGKKKK